MSDTHIRGTRQFGVKKEPQTITISGNGSSKQYKVNPSVLIITACVFSLFMAGYVVSTGYLAFRDDLISSSIVQQARIKHEYEDRIAALRSKVDKITSRQLLDQKSVEAQVSSLVKQQELLTGRTGELDGLLERAKKSGLSTSNLAVPSQTPILQPSLTQSSSMITLDPVNTGSISLNNTPSFASSFRGSSFDSNLGNNVEIAYNEHASNDLFGAVSSQIQSVQKAQLENIQKLRKQAKDRTNKIIKVFADLNIPLSKKMKANIGGPFEPANDNFNFSELSNDLINKLNTLDKLRNQTYALPVSNPVSGSKISSRFGNRVDPFRKKTAFHSGIDFKAHSGKAIKAAGSGKVVKAGRSGGYGLLVEVDHGNGITSRYAHMRKINVKVGQMVGRGKTLGQVGSTGRSTGPHLHFEVRRYGKATNPMKYFNIGRKLNKLL